LNHCPPQKGQIQGDQGEDNCVHSCFSYKHYSRLNDHCALQAPPKITKSPKCCKILDERF